MGYFLRGALVAVLLSYCSYAGGQAPTVRGSTQPPPANSTITPPPANPQAVADTFPMSAKPLLASQFNGIFYVDGFPYNGCTVNSIVYKTRPGLRSSLGCEMAYFR